MRLLEVCEMSVGVNVPFEEDWQKEIRGLLAQLASHNPLTTP